MSWMWMRGFLAGYVVWTSISVIASIIGSAARNGNIGAASICSFVGASVMYCAWIATIVSLRRPRTRNEEHALYIGGLLALTWFQQPLGTCILYSATAPIESFQDGALGFFLLLVAVVYIIFVLYLVVYIAAPQTLEQYHAPPPQTVWILVEQPDDTLYIGRTPQTTQTPQTPETLC